MNLVIDIGNSKIKMAVFDYDCIVFKISCQKKELLKVIDQLLNAYTTLDYTILSDVGKTNPDILNKIAGKIKLVTLSVNLKFPFQIKYKTPATLGVDRLALVAASVKHYPNQNTLIIDAGTCITYDFVNEKNQYFGGAISPGVNMRYKALSNQTKNLPFLNPQYLNHFIGQSTQESIHSGIMNGIIYEIEGFLTEYSKKHADLTVILTGGDAKLLSIRLKNTIFAKSNFLLEGLNHILEYNLQE